MDPWKDNHIARRREQNRLAQRRSRLKQSQQRASARKQERHNETASASSISPQPSQLATPPFSIIACDTTLSPSYFSMPELDEPASHDRVIPCPAALGGGVLDQLYPDFPETVEGGLLIRQPSLCAPTYTSGMIEGVDGSLAGDQSLIRSTATGLIHQPSDPLREPLGRGSGSEADLGVEFEAGPERGWLGPLHLAAAKGNDRIVRILLRHQSTPDFGCVGNCDSGVNEPDSDGMTALMHAVQGGFEDVVRSLLDAGAAVDGTDRRRRTPVHWAVLARREGLLRQLLEHGVAAGANLDVYDAEGRTPLHSAISMGFEVGVQVLLEFGVNARCRAQKP